MEAQRYRIVLTGEIMEGHDPDEAIKALAALFKQPPEKLRHIFNRKPISFNQEVDLSKARQIQARLHAVGAACTLQPVGEVRPAANFLPDEPPAVAAPPPATARTMTCPKCGHAQPEAQQCARCGIIVSKFRMELAESPEAPVDEEHLLNLFVNSNADKYLRKFGYFRADDGFAFTWHWPAFFVAPLWALYRKMWGWAVIMFITSFVPFATILWAVTANFLYYRHAKSRIAKLGKRPDEDRVAAAGGTSALAVFVGIGLHFLLAFVFMSAIMGKMAQYQEEYAAASADMTREASKTPEGSKTAVILQKTVFITQLWIAAGNDVSAASMQKIADDLDQPVDAFRDGWGNVVQITPSAAGFVVRSAGADGEFNSADDLTLAPPALAQ